MANTDILQVVLQAAVDLRAEKEAIYEKVNANRRMLRDFDTQGLLSAEQSRWLADFYPVKKRGGSDADAE